MENNITNDITDENTDIDKELIDLESEPKELRIEYQTHFIASSLKLRPSVPDIIPS